MTAGELWVVLVLGVALGGPTAVALLEALAVWRAARAARRAAKSALAGAAGGLGRFHGGRRGSPRGKSALEQGLPGKPARAGE